MQPKKLNPKTEGGGGLGDGLEINQILFNLTGIHIK